MVKKTLLFIGLISGTFFGYVVTMTREDLLSQLNNAWQIRDYAGIEQLLAQDQDLLSFEDLVVQKALVDSELKLLQLPMTELRAELQGGFDKVELGILGIVIGAGFEYYRNYVLNRCQSEIERANAALSAANQLQENAIRTQIKLLEDKINSAGMDTSTTSLENKIEEWTKELTRSSEFEPFKLITMTGLAVRNWPAIASFVAGMGTVLYGLTRIAWTRLSDAWSPVEDRDVLLRMQKILDAKIADVAQGICLSPELKNV